MCTSIQSIQINKFSDLAELQPTLKQQCPDSRISYINKTRQQVAHEAENLLAAFRGTMIAAGSLGIAAVAIKVATVVGTFGLAAMSVGWALAIVALAITAIAIGILIYRHFTSIKHGYDPKTTKEMFIGLGLGSLAGTATAIIITACKFIGSSILTFVPKPGGTDCSGWTVLGYSKKPHPAGKINLTEGSPQLIDNDEEERFPQSPSMIRVYKHDKVEVPAPVREKVA